MVGREFQVLGAVKQKARPKKVVLCNGMDREQRKFAGHMSKISTAVGLFLLLVQRSGTHCPKTCGIRSVLWTVTDSHWRHFIFAVL